jgi:hypothetical protein
VAILTSSNQFRRTPLVSSGASAASQNSHSYLTTQASSADTQDAMGSNLLMSTPARVNGNTVLLTHHHDMKDFRVQNVAAMTAVGMAMTPDRVGTLQQRTTFITVPTKAVDNLVVLLSNAELKHFVDLRVLMLLSDAGDAKESMRMISICTEIVLGDYMRISKLTSRRTWMHT